MKKPKKGDRFAIVVTDKRGVTFVRSRTVVKLGIEGLWYTPKRAVRYATYPDWAKWAKRARKSREQHR